LNTEHFSWTNEYFFKPGNLRSVSWIFLSHSMGSRFFFWTIEYKPGKLHSKSWIFLSDSTGLTLCFAKHKHLTWDIWIVLKC
jgi:hypothetical protein